MQQHMRVRQKKRSEKGNSLMPLPAPDMNLMKEKPHINTTLGLFLGLEYISAFHTYNRPLKTVLFSGIQLVTDTLSMRNKLDPSCDVEKAAAFTLKESIHNCLLWRCVFINCDYFI